MASYTDHDLSEYYLNVAAVSTTTAGTIHYIPIPAGGHVVRVAAAIVVVPTDVADVITFEIGGSDLEVSGAAAAMTLPTTATIGDTVVTTFDFEASANKVLEAEDDDALADGSVLEIITSGASTVGTASFTITIRR